MFAVFTFGPIVTSGGFCEFVTAALNKWAAGKDIIIEEQTVKMALTPDGQRMFVTIVIRYGSSR